MRKFVSKPVVSFLQGAVLLLIVATSGCQQQPATNTSTNTTTNTSNINATNTSSVNANTTTTTATIATSEPDKYSATITLKLEVTGSRNISTPPLTANFARDGSNRRISFKIPGGDEVIYLDRADKRYVIVPNRKQYAEIDAQSTGFEMPSMMTPAQIVN